ncbi:N-carbamoyl-L-amino-acid hydrolase [Pseudorhizobium tarimense]|uniref:N-carbamoyl-L-amino-acid hydrolase n=1 Tax=Pseudorhizobium tarimense TaxID=1079109 RepID=A0ABV2HBZ4_9HYPH|nr:hydantoinase/carbamoylase family amidase [Pseudorhizobium tarimense]MCJ8521072.1 hydantoinase/carbamoylase family amidase [Pseudorhizobium tarimense]
MTGLAESAGMDQSATSDSAPVDIQLAERLFDELKRRTGTNRGITRTSYGLGEQIAHDMVRREARKLGLEVKTDPGCNLYMRMKGREKRPGIFIGSHLDSVPMGGNFDGAAGVLIGLSVVSGYVRAGIRPPRDITVMAVRAEESTWFGASYVGSRAALGRLTGKELDQVKRSSDQISLGAAIDAAGGDTEFLRSGKSYLDPADIAMFIEPHIEQGPVLLERQIPVGIVTGIRGSFRYREAKCIGVYAHSGATPREYRSDAVRAASALVTKLDKAWDRLQAEGADLVVTFGQFSTDPSEAAFSKIAGKLSFSLDVRSQEPQTLARMQAIVIETVARIEAEHRVKFELGRLTDSKSAKMDDSIVTALSDFAREQGIETETMACGAGHDAAVFADAGVPTGMVFIRNANGSHNPDEHMDIADFAEAARLVSALCLDPPLKA